MSPQHSATNASGWYARPIVRRLYAALVAALAVFLVAILLVREPFRGYLAVARISGLESEALPLDHVKQWLETASPVDVKVIGVADQSQPRRVVLSVEHVGQRSVRAVAPLNVVTHRFVHEYVPQRIEVHRQATIGRLQSKLEAARDRENQRRDLVNELRQRQLAQRNEPPVPSVLASAIPTQAEPLTAGDVELERRQSHLRMELTRLGASFSDIHPQIVSLKQQLEEVQRQLSVPAALRHPAENSAPANNDFRSDPDAQSGSRTRQTAHLLPISTVGPSHIGDPPPSDLAAQIEEALGKLTSASMARQAAQIELQTALHALATQPTAADWSADSARIVARLGGTPRLIPLSLAMLVSLVAGAIMFRSSPTLVASPKIATASDLAAAFELPVVGQTPLLGFTRGRSHRPMLGPRLVSWTVRAAEAFLVAIALLCVISTLADPGLAGQFGADPLGTLSEIVGRVSPL